MIWNSKRVKSNRLKVKRSFPFNFQLLTFNLVFLLVSARSAAAQEFDLARIQQATVFIMQATASADQLTINCVGSGTIVSRDGLILTNAHNTVANRSCPGDTLIVSMSIRLDEPPVPVYQAEVAQADAGLDLALLRITRQNDGRIVDPAALALPYVELGDSDALALDATVTTIGYPDLGDTPVGIERGTVSGFTTEPSGGSKSWIKTSASIPGTMTGGGVYDQQGRLIGVPTTSPVIGLSPDARCVTLQDTNGDGAMNSSDICVPVGGFINSLRPSSFVRPLLRAASLDLQLDTIGVSGSQTQAAGTPRFSRLFFSPSVNEAQMPSSVVTSLPSGTDSVYLFFNYADMTPETVYEVRVTSGGIPNPAFSLSPVRWSGGRNGVWYVGSTGQPWPNGIYDFTLFIDGNAADSKRLLVGQAPQAVPAFSDLVFGIQDLRGNVLGNGWVLPTGSVASARFIYRNMVDGTPWTAVWYYQGSEVRRDEFTWSDGASGAKTISVQDPNGLLPGSYRLELYIQEESSIRLAATSDFTLAGAQEGAYARIFGDAHFTTANSAEEAIQSPPITGISAGAPAIYALFDWEQIAQGTLWTMRWSVDGDVFYEQTQPWNNAESGDNFLIRLASSGGVPDGTYRMELFIGKVSFESTEARVGIGQLPIDRFAQATGVQMRGQVLDGETYVGIPGVSVVVISEDFSVSEFTEQWSQNQVYAMAVTDTTGSFLIDRLLQPAVLYSVFVIAEGYLPIAADAVEVTTDMDSVNVPIYLTRG
ncbi:MAG: trypsin-like peptidase domain-containing protein [Anaerolineae bacterium]|nr:trypsin-like peptidase domain-containing protein [Anaerolineae bacterium]